MNDSRNKSIVEGKPCAFNWSGQVKLGIVMRVNRRTVRVRHTEPPWRGHISIMRNPHSVMMLDKDMVV